MGMGEIQIIARKIFLKKQSIGLIVDEILELQEKSSLLSLKNQLEDELKEAGFDSVISRKLDCVIYLWEN